jgi:hypothetical protein
MEWCKVWALSSSPSTAKIRKKERKKKSLPRRLGKVADTCNSSYLRSREQFEASLSKKFSRPHLNQ